MTDYPQESMRELLVAGIIALAVGIGVGWWGEGLFRKGIGAEANEVAAVGKVPEVDANGIDAFHEDAFERWLNELDAMGMRVVPEDIFDHLAIYPLDHYGRVNEVARELFLFTDQEVERLNEVIEEVEATLMTAELERLEVLHRTDEEMVFLIPAFPEEGGRIREALLERLIAELGEADGKLFWELMNRTAEGSVGARRDWWRSFGQVDREVVFALHGTALSSLSEEDGELRLIEEPGDEPFHESEAWLHYAEIELSDHDPVFFDDDEREPSSMSLKMRVSGEDEEGREEDLNTLIGRFRYLVPHLPDTLQVYFQD